MTGIIYVVNGNNVSYQRYLLSWQMYCRTADVAMLNGNVWKTASYFTMKTLPF